MIKKIIFVIVFLVSSSQAYGQEKIAEIQFKETLIDYGIIENGEDGKKNFRIQKYWQCSFSI